MASSTPVSSTYILPFEESTAIRPVSEIRDSLKNIVMKLNDLFKAFGLGYITPPLNEPMVVLSQYLENWTALFLQVQTLSESNFSGLADSIPTALLKTVHTLYKAVQYSFPTNVADLTDLQTLIEKIKTTRSIQDLDMIQPGLNQMVEEIGKRPKQKVPRQIPHEFTVL